MCGSVQNRADADGRTAFNFAIRVDDRADSGVRGPDHIAAILSRPDNSHPQMLIRRGRLSKPPVVGDQNEQTRAASDKLAHQIWKYALVTNDRGDLMIIHSA